MILSSGKQAEELVAVAGDLNARVVAISSMDVYRAWGKTARVGDVGIVACSPHGAALCKELISTLLPVLDALRRRQFKNRSHKR